MCAATAGAVRGQRDDVVPDGVVGDRNDRPGAELTVGAFGDLPDRASSSSRLGRAWCPTITPRTAGAGILGLPEPVLHTFVDAVPDFRNAAAHLCRCRQP